MSSYFKTPVIVFGLAVPLVLMAVVAIIIVVFTGRVDEKLALNTVQYEKGQNTEKAIVKLQKKVGQNAAHLKQWQDTIDSGSRESFLAHWKEVEKDLSGREFSRLSHTWLRTNDGLGKGVGQPVMQVEMNFLATFRAMQQALIAIESRSPQIQLDSFSMIPDSEKTRLNFKAKFTIWTKK